MIKRNRNLPILIGIIIVAWFAEKETTNIMKITNRQIIKKLFLTKAHLESLTLMHESSCITKNELLSAIAIFLRKIYWLFEMNLNKNNVKVSFRSNQNKN